jgi:hypothetical protein
MTFPRVRTISSLALAATAVLALPAGTAVAKKSTKAPTFPVVKKVTPKQVGVGDLLTIKGTGFRSGKNKNTVVFKRFGQRAIFVKAETATKTAITLHVPLKLQAYMKVVNNQPVPSSFAIRIIARRFGRKFTKSSISPMIGPAGSGITAPGVTPPSAYEQCLSHAQATPAGDEDKDSLTNDLEKRVGTDPCRADTDTDGLADGWEYQSALDLNSRALPYPGKKPWPNPLDPEDGKYDFDGDGLTTSQEFALWQYAGGTFAADGTIGAYSDGTQNTGGPMLVTTPAQQALDLDLDGNLTDEERDADNDGLSNQVEWNYTGTQNWWAKIFINERPYTWRTFAELNAADPDSDGDGVLDGADDQDEDGWDNYTEMQLWRVRVPAGYARPLRTQPFNPCLPDPYSRSCGRWVPLDAGSAWPPFDGSQAAGDTMPFDGTQAADPAQGWDGVSGGPQGPGYPGP